MSRERYYDIDLEIKATVRVWVPESLSESTAENFANAVAATTTVVSNDDPMYVSNLSSELIKLRKDEQLDSLEFRTLWDGCSVEPQNVEVKIVE